MGLKKPNAWVSTTCSERGRVTLDVYGPYPRVDPARTRPAPPRDPRGWSGAAPLPPPSRPWRSFPPALRCAARTGTPESYQLSHVGLRVVQEIE